jgi:uncharacterized protein
LPDEVTEGKILTMAQASREFQIFAKPVGAICNLDCHYCYYLKNEKHYPKGTFRMSEDTLENYIIQHMEACPTPEIRFSWHGGEPTLLGLDYFRKIVELQRKHQPPDRQIANGIQTNGTLLDNEWCQFFAEERFNVGISVDGPRELHDHYRVTKGQKPTHNQVMRGYRLLRKHKVSTDLLCVVHEQNVRHPQTVYRFFKEIGAEYLTFLPLVNRVENSDEIVTSHSVPAEEYGTFLCTVFNEWIRNDVGRIMVQMFDEAARPAFGMEHSLCIFRETCGDIPILEHNGDVYSCDHFVEREYFIGNVNDTPLAAMLESEAQQKFGEDKRDTLPRFCRECEVRDMCNGGCPKDRIIKTPDGENGLNYLCAGFKKFFNYSRPYFQQMASLTQSGQPIEQIMAMVRARDVENAPLKVGRNDPCPCGSGRKYKKCCFGKSPQPAQSI